MAKETDGLSEVMRKEKDAKVYKKIMALTSVPEDDVGVPETARRDPVQREFRAQLAGEVFGGRHRRPPGSSPFRMQARGGQKKDCR